MNDKYFLDSNIVLYTLDKTSFKNSISRNLLSHRPVLSTQVIMECINISIRKIGYSKIEAFENAKFLIYNSDVVVITDETLLQSFHISNRYGYSHWDSLIIAAAVSAGCSILYSGDLQHNQVIDETLKIVNPFL